MTQKEIVTALLGGYTAEDVTKEIYEATRAEPPCKS